MLDLEKPLSDFTLPPEVFIGGDAFPLLDLDETNVEIFRRACEVPAISKESAETVKNRLLTFEANLNERFGEYMDQERLTMANKVMLLPTKDFLLKWQEDNHFINEDTMRNTIAFRNTEGSSIFVHTTEVSGYRNPEPRSLYQVTYTAMHELVHGKCAPKVYEQDGKDYRATGCKIIEITENGEKFGHHTGMYEAQTELINQYASRSKEDIASGKVGYGDLEGSFMVAVVRAGTGYLKETSALINVMETAFPDLQEGMNFLGRCYFQCDSTGFFEGLVQGVLEHTQDKQKALNLMEEFYKASFSNDSSQMAFVIGEVEGLGRI